MVFENGVKNIQAAAYNSACTVFHICQVLTQWILTDGSLANATVPFSWLLVCMESTRFRDLSLRGVNKKK